MAMMSTSLALMIGALAVLIFCTIPIDAAESVEKCGKHKLKCPQAPPHSDRTCKNGKCGFKCKEPWADCDNSKDNGCETNLDSSPMNCGRCGHQCTAPNNATIATCEDRKCRVKCKSGFKLCRGSCISVQNDARNCGACGHVCPQPPNTVFNPSPCHLAACVAPPGCVDGFFDCDGNVTNGCEVDLRHDQTFCANCATACPSWSNSLSIENRVASCVFNQTTGICEIDRNFSAGCHCGPGPNECFVSYVDCDGNIVNGCEQLGTSC